MNRMTKQGMAMGESIVRLTPVSKEADCLIFIEGEGMEPVYHDGQAVFFVDTDSLKPGDVGIIIYNGQLMIRQYLVNRLIAFNPIREDIIIKPEDTFEVVGKVIGALEYEDVDDDFIEQQPRAAKYYRR